MTTQIENQGVRLDKWLWAARMYKTRRLAKNAIEGGKVHYNGKKSKVSKMVEMNAELKITQGIQEKIIIIKGLSSQRNNYTEASKLYIETKESIKKREETLSIIKSGHANISPQKKPNKKERRSIMNFKNKDL
jgi:ribosome-associated heat shock protein Hsp15